MTQEISTTSLDRERRYLLIAALAFACMVGIMWGAYNPVTGMPDETGYTYMSETSSVLRGFFYEPDPMRIHANTFYHLGYVLGEVFGIRGSYLPYQLLYALLWWARGMLVFAILRKLLPAAPSLCFCAGAFTLTHASDGILMFLNHFGYIFWMLLAMYAFLLAWEETRRPLAVAIGAAFLEYMSLWSYESQILLLLTFPLIVMVARREWRKPVPLVAWYLVPTAYVVQTLIRYSRTAGHSYQESVLRKSWSVASIAHDWGFHIATSLKFWDWENSGWRTPREFAHVLGALAVLAFLAGWIAVLYTAADRDRSDARTSGRLLAFGLVILTLSFPAYLLLESGGTTWRTQMLSGPGSAIVMAALVGLLACLPLPRFARLVFALPAASAIVYCGSVAAISKGGVHMSEWERHRTAMLEVLRIAPRVQPGTVFVMTNVSKEEDPFHHDMWFDVGLRLAYPGVPVSGVYYYADGTPGTGDDLAIHGASWKRDGNAFYRLVTEAPLDKTVAIQFDPSGRGTLLPALPPLVCNATCTGSAYRPGAPILPGPPSPIAVHRFRVPWKEGQ